MANFKETFPNKHAVLPVIHVETHHQMMKDAEVAYDEGADGVFLISMIGMSSRILLDWHKLVRQEIPRWFIGVNLLGVYTADVFDKLDSSVSGVWTDNAHIDESSERQIEAAVINKKREESGWKGLYFGGVAFKYQKEVRDLAAAAKSASHFMDVVTTSGDGTGHPANPEKIKTMKDAIGKCPLGIASGISAENVEDYKDSADAFLVATSLFADGTESFDKFKVRDLVKAVRGI
jgi:hypothetical protein